MDTVTIFKECIMGDYIGPRNLGVPLEQRLEGPLYSLSPWVCVSVCLWDILYNVFSTPQRVRALKAGLCQLLRIKFIYKMF